MYAGSPRELGDIIGERRVKKGWSQKRLADTMGASRLWVVAVESGSPRTQLGMVLRALRCLDLSTDIFHETSGDEVDEMLGH